MASLFYRTTVCNLLQGAVLLSLFFFQTTFAKQIGNLERLTVTARLQPNGFVSVEQTLEFSSPQTLDWEILSNPRMLRVQDHERELAKNLFTLKKSDEAFRLTSERRSAVWRVSYLSPSSLIRHSNRDQIYIKILESSGYNINEVRVSLALPAANINGLGGNIYAIGGAEQPQVTQDANQLTYTAANVSARAIFTVNASWPKAVITLSWPEELRLLLLNLELLPWLTVGLLLPLFTLAVLLRLIIKQRAAERYDPKVSVNQIPSSLSPLIVGVLVDKKIYPKEIIALIIDLCQRGYLVIVKKGGRYYLGQRRRVDESLESWEAAIVEELFPLVDHTVSQDELKLLSRRSLFSPKIRRAFGRIYQVVTDMNLFTENPHRTRIKYKLVALLLYFLAIIAAVWTALSGASTYLLIPALGTMAMSQTVIRLSPKLVRYTKKGKELRDRWIAFGKTLAKRESLPLEASQGRLFERHLPYAVVLNQTAAWARRFDNAPTVMLKPDWFISYEEQSASQFTEEVVKFTESISRLIAELKGPLVT